MIPALIVILVLFLLAMIWLGVEVRFSDSQLTVYARVFFIRFRVYPVRRRKKKPKKDKKGKKTEASEKKRKKKSPGHRPGVRELVDLVLDAAGKLKRKITVTKLNLRYTAGSKDPGDTALQYGRVCAAVGILLPRICEAFKVRSHDVKVNADFEIEKPVIELDAALGMFLWQILYVGVSAFIGFLKLKSSGK